MDGAGTPMFHLTKGAIRRYPINAGAGCYHITTREPDTIAVGRAFLEGIGFRGFAHVEFKRDPRDGKIKVMECNPRFTVPHELLTRAGIDTSQLVYNHLVGIPLPKVDSYKVGLRLWFPIEDYAAYRQLRASGELTFWGWLKSLSHPLIIPELSFSDPKPAFRLFVQIARRTRKSSPAPEP
jgi:predicted ATP-grasp superfamily ATP-dependent carboligase